MALILSIETSTPVCSVALSENGKLLHSKENRDGYAHSSHLTVLIEELFNEQPYQMKDLDAVAVSSGPGSYTGLRIGVSTAKGICFALSIDLIAINSLETMTWSFVEDKNVAIPENAWLCPMIDARRMEVYTALYNPNVAQQTEITAEIIDEESFNEILVKRQLLFMGDGSHKCSSVITHSNAVFVSNIHPLAKHMAVPSYKKFKLGKFEDVAYFEPFYLKDFVATKPKNKVF